MSGDQDEIGGRLSELVQRMQIGGSDPNYCFDPHQLCSVCSHITTNSEVLDVIASGQSDTDALIEIWSHHNNEADLRESISRGCHLCLLLYIQAGYLLARYSPWPDAGLPRGQLHLYISTIGNVKVQHPSGHPRFHFEFGLGKPNQTDGKVRPHAPLLLARELPNPNRPHDSFLTASTGSDASFVTANKWMSQCLKEHKCCAAQGEFPVYLPKRLLEITEDPLNPKIKLIETGGRQKSDVPYLTLSHCWGTQLPLRLQQDNYPVFLERIEYADLPQLFKDAAKITIRLGFKYLWIDAMCIIQDHDIDWDEALRMSEVFGNSVCTISALAAKDSTETCFYDRLPVGFVPCQIKTSSGGTLEVVSWRARHTLTWEAPTCNKTPLHRRAWVMQERYLTPRQIHFSQNQIAWQCCEASFSEIHQTATKSLPFLRAELRQSVRPAETIEKPIFVKDAFWKGRYTGRFIQTGSDSKMDWHSAYWNLMMFWYTPGNLSREQDRWPAVSGIAKMIEIITGVRMVAGLWVSHLMFDMLWITEYAPTNRRIENGQPSWSWLSVNSEIYQTPVKWDDSIPLDKRFTAEILELPEMVHDPLDAETPYFYLPSKPLSMLIRAPMMRFPDIPEGFKLDPDLDMPWERFKRTAEPFSNIVARFLLQGYTCWTPDYDISINDLSDAWVLQWTRHEDYSRNHKHHRVDRQFNISGLIVKPLDSEQTKWCRLGKFRFCYSGMKGKPIGELKTIRLY